jgi:hypothetical protein
MLSICVNAVGLKAGRERRTRVKACVHAGQAEFRLGDALD